MRFVRKVMVLAAWAAIAATSPAAEARMEVAATTGMVADLVRQVGGERVHVHQLMGAGVDPHLYKPTAADAAVLARAEVVFYNGLGLEGRMASLFERMAAAGRRTHAVAIAVPEDLLVTAENGHGQPDPHIWMDAALWARCAGGVAWALAEADPEGRAFYDERAKEAQQRLLDLDAWLRTRAQELPAERRVLVTSHDAFGYFGRAYGFRVLAPQGISTVSEASLADITALADFLRHHRVPAVFVETSVNPAAVERVASDAGVKIGGELFSDAMGPPGEMRHGFDTSTYDGMMRANMMTILQALRGDHTEP